MIACLEKDILKTSWIKDKCKNSSSYAQNLYAALCNNRFFKNDEEWACSWRFAGELVADLIDNDGDYLDYYCSGMSAGRISNYVSEGVVTSEITNDLLNLGWSYKPYDDSELENNENL